MLHLKYNKHFKSEHGGHGAGALKTGKQGKDTIIEVPVGTIAKDDETGDVLFEVTEDGQEYILQRGGRGGLETIISNLLQIKRHDMLNQVNQD